MENTTIKFTPVNIEERKKLDIRSGDTVKVHLKIQEKGKTRIQIFEGLVLAVKHGKETGGTFTVRKVMSGVGVEKIFPIYSPNIEKVEVMKRSKVRRAKLYYIRDKVAREIRRKMRRMIATPLPEKIQNAPMDEEVEETKDEAPKDSVEETKTEATPEAVEEKKEEKTEEVKEEKAEVKEEKKEEAPKEEKKEEEKK